MGTVPVLSAGAGLLLDQAKAVGSDHALVIADLELPSRGRSADHAA